MRTSHQDRQRQRAPTGLSASLGIQSYQVTFDDEYITPFEAGAGTLPPFYKARADPHAGVYRRSSSTGVDRGASPQRVECVPVMGSASELPPLTARP